MNHPIDVLLSRLEGVKEISAGKYKARCPAHDDKSPSLSVTEKDGKVLIHCYAECEAEEIMTAMGLTLAELFEKPLYHRGTPIPRRDRWDARASLKLLDNESRIALMAAIAVVEGRPLDATDLERVRMAQSRIARIMEIHYDHS